MTRYLIVGFGAAGLAAAESIRERDAAGEIVVLTEEGEQPYSRPGLAYLLSRKLPERQLRTRTPAELADLALTTIQARVELVDPVRHVAIDDRGREHPFDRVLLATGSRAVKPRFDGSGLDGVFQLDGLADARDFMARARRARSAIVVGGGPTAIELVEGLRAHGVRTHYFLRRDRFWSGVLDPEESELVHARLAGEGVALHRRAEVTRALGSAGRLVGVDTAAGERLDCDLLCVAVGVVSRTEALKDVPRLPDGGLAVDGHMCAGGDLYAAGDVARMPDPATGELTGDVLWTTAVEQGRIAGGSMAGADAVYRHDLSLNVTRLCGLTTTIIGRVGEGEDPDLVTLSRGESRGWRRRLMSWKMIDRHGYDRLRVIVGERRIMGAVVMGDQGVSRLLVRAIRRELDLGPIWDRLLADRDHALPALMDFIAHRPEVTRAAGAA